VWVEGATCPRCGSIARDRFLHHAMQWRRPPRPGERVLETSPRLDERYRNHMGRHFDYTSSDYDLGAHRGAIQLDLQAIDLPDASVDVVLTPHVLEHVPDTDAALDELRRILAPGGRVALQVPVLQRTTAPPSEPEFHGDNTPVFWRFGYDLTARLRERAWDVRVLCTEEWVDAVTSGVSPWAPDAVDPTFDVPGILAGAAEVPLEASLDRATSRRYGIEPGYQFVTWVCDAPPSPG
jgi:SAM-dependent methyltransferase